VKSSGLRTLSKILRRSIRGRLRSPIQFYRLDKRQIIKMEKP